jgi:hypothetical protein
MASSGIEHRTTPIVAQCHNNYATGRPYKPARDEVPVLHYAMKTYWGSGCVDPRCLHLGSIWEMSFERIGRLTSRLSPGCG